MTTVNFGTSAQATAVTSLAPSLAMPPASYSRPTMNPVMFCRNTSGMPALAGELDEVGALQRRLREEDAVVGEDADRVAVDVGEAADQRVAVERLELVEHASRRRSARSPRARRRGGARRRARRRTARRGRARAARGSCTPPVGRPAAAEVAPRSRGRSRARGSSSAARWSATPELRAWTSAPPSSSAVTSSPVAAFTSGGPPRKIVPVPRTITVSSHIAGT